MNVKKVFLSSITVLLACQAIQTSANDTELDSNERIETRGGTTIIRNSRNGIGNRIIIDGQVVGTGKTKHQVTDVPHPHPHPHLQLKHDRVGCYCNRIRWKPNQHTNGLARWSSRLNQDRLRYTIPIVRAETIKTDRSRLNELIDDPIVQEYVPAHVLELLKEIAEKHSGDSTEDETIQDLENRNDQ